MAKKQPSARIEIARIEDQVPGNGAAIFSFIMLFIAAFAMFFEIMLDTSAVRLAAWGTVWTGYNVFWGALLVAVKRTVLVVTRVDPAVGSEDDR